MMAAPTIRALVFAAVIILLVGGCRSRGSRDVVTGSWDPTFAVNDPEEGLFTDPPRRGVRPDTYRFRLGMYREWKNGTKVGFEAGRENSHVGAFSIKVEKALNNWRP